MKGGTGGSFPGRGRGKQLQGSRVPGFSKRDLYRQQDSLIGFARRLRAEKPLVGITEPLQSKNQIVIIFMTPRNHFSSSPSMES